MIDQKGLVWEPNIWGPQPKWAVEPSLEAVAKAAYQHLNLSDAEVASSSIEFLIQGGFNKIYTVVCPFGDFIMRVTLPVDPGYKLASDVATIDLMFHMRSNAIGNAYRASDFKMLKDPSMQALNIMPGYVLGKVVSMDFFWDKRITQDIERGPFHICENWLEKRLLLVRSEADAVVANSSDKDDINAAKYKLRLITGLLELMPKYFQDEGLKNGSGWCCMHHDDLTRHNILVNRLGVVQGILDWECVNYVPLWKACQIPAFLRSCDRNEKPVQHIYEHNEGGTPGDGYLEDQGEYESTLLRQVFLERMAQVQPLWTDIHQASSKKRDFWLAVDSPSNSLCLTRIRKWLDAQVTDGAYYNFHFDITQAYH